MLSWFAIEVWTKYAVATTIMILRFVTRWKMVGWRKFDGTDLWCVISTALYTTVSTCDYLLSTPKYPTIIGLNAETAMQVPDEDIPLLERGSKIAHFSWTMYICMIFSFKGVMLFFLKKVGSGIWEVQIFYATIFTVCAWIASVLTHLCACVPVERVWQVKPFPGPYCTTRPQNYYVAGVLNMLTDFIIMIIPIPMVWRLRINIFRKIALGLLFGSGIFIIICTILRTYYSLGDVGDIAVAQSWAGREGLVSMIVVSAPGIWPLIRKSRWFDSTYRRSNSSDDHTTGEPSARRWKISGSGRGRRRRETDLGTMDHDGYYELPARSPAMPGAEPVSTSGSQECIVGPPAVGGKDGVMPITVTTEYSVEHEEATLAGGQSLHPFARMRSSDWVN